MEGMVSGTNGYWNFHSLEWNEQYLKRKGKNMLMQIHKM